MEKRKIIQILYKPDRRYDIRALCDDGTIWDWDSQDDLWYQPNNIDPIPQPEKHKNDHPPLGAIPTGFPGEW